MTAPFKYFSSLLLLTSSTLLGVEFTVVAYNVENLFDVDGVAIYDDYTQDEADDPFTYSKSKLLTKISNTARVLQSVNEGAGPEVILFQELEGDFTLASSIDDLERFVRSHASLTVTEMLTERWRDDYSGISAVAWLAKALDDAGMGPYHVTVAKAKPRSDNIAHVNAVFSKFPIESATYHPIEQARDIAEVELNIEGHTLWLYNNHWKSGASNPDREPTRVANAKVLRRLIDARLDRNPQADIIIGGDLNSHYNHSLLYPSIETGINDVLGSQGDERLGENDLYNLWFELEPEARYSEVWRANRGTLMHLIITRGLYDTEGINYIDGSFDKLVLPGINIDALGRPLEWSFAGDFGGGYSDHLPVMARFSTSPFKAAGPPSTGTDAPDYEIPLRYSSELDLELEDGSFLSDTPDSNIGPYIGKLYSVQATVESSDPLRLRIGETLWSAYSYDSAIRSLLGSMASSSHTKPIELIVTLGIWNSERQFLVEAIR